MNKWGIILNMIIPHDINGIQTNIINILPTPKDIILTLLYTYPGFGIGDMLEL